MNNNDLTKALSQLLGIDKLKEKKDDTEVQHQGSKITLPAEPKRMQYGEAIEVLSRKMQQDQMTVAIYEEIDAFPLDGAHAFMQVLKQRYGWADAMPTPGFFGPTPPQTINLEIGVNKSIQVIWGQFAVHENRIFKKKTV